MSRLFDLAFGAREKDSSERGALSDPACRSTDFAHRVALLSEAYRRLHFRAARTPRGARLANLADGTETAHASSIRAVASVAYRPVRPSCKGEL